MGQKHCSMEDQKPVLWLAGNQNFAEGGGFEPKINKFSRDLYIKRCGEETSIT